MAPEEAELVTPVVVEDTPESSTRAVEMSVELGSLLGWEIEVVGESATVKTDAWELEAKLEEILLAWEESRTRSVSEEAAVFTARTYESVLRTDRFFPLFRMGEETEVVDETNGRTYHIGPTSLAATLSLLRELKKRNLLDHGRARMLQHRKPETVADAFRRAAGLQYAIRITASADTDIATFERQAQRFLFQVAYNIDRPLIQRRLFDDLDREARIRRFRRGGIKEIDAPKREYDPELVAHYQMALSAEDPSLQFLSFFHILENFFETVYLDELADDLKRKLTHPSFSPRRPGDVRGVIASLRERLRKHKQEHEWDEREALELVLKRYVDAQEFYGQLEKFDPLLLEYYQTKRAEFANAPVLLEATQPTDARIKRLALRLYAVRNAIVHSKEGNKARFRPFRDERDLLKEIPLVRFAAEAAIIESAE